MKKRVNDIKKNTDYIAEKNKLIAVLIATSISLGGTQSVFAKNEFDNYSGDTSSDSIVNNFDINKVIDSLYQKQMDYLVSTLEKLNDFYKKEDTKNIIKNGYPTAYSVLSSKINYDKYYNGYDYDYISKSDDKLNQIINNNILINELMIKPEGNGRDPEYGIIHDKNSANGIGFRRKTEEDKKLIDNYTNIVGNRIFIDNNIIDIINSIKSGENNNELLLNALESIYNKQMNYIYDTTLKLKVFYSTIDTKNIIKNGYENAYNSINKDMNAYIISSGSKEHYFINKDMADNEMSEEEKINKYIDLIKMNESAIYSLKIKTEENGRSTDYGIIFDKNSANGMGFRVKTEEDKRLINEYTQLLGKYDYTPIEIIELLSNINSNKKMLKK